MKHTLYKSLLLLFIINQGISAQETYTVNPSNSTLEIEGTSNVHDWQMKAEKMNSKLELKRDEQKISDISQASFSINSKDIESDNSIMNNKTHDALGANKYEQIKFELKSVSNIKNSSDNFSGVASGILSIAGKTKLISFPFKGNLNGNSSLLLSGNEKIKMSDFGIKPPTAMLGALKTGDEVIVKFELEYTKSYAGLIPDKN